MTWRRWMPRRESPPAPQYTSSPSLNSPSLAQKNHHLSLPTCTRHWQTAKFEDWCERESDKLAATLDDNDSIAIEKDMLRAAQIALATRSSSTTTRARGFVDAWKSLATDFSTNKWNAAVSAVRNHNDELARVSLVNDFDATERAFNAAHDEVEAFMSW